MSCAEKLLQARRLGPWEGGDNRLSQWHRLEGAMLPPPPRSWSPSPSKDAEGGLGGGKITKKL